MGSCVHAPCSATGANELIRDPHARSSMSAGALAAVIRNGRGSCSPRGENLESPVRLNPSASAFLAQSFIGEVASVRSRYEEVGWNKRELLVVNGDYAFALIRQEPVFPILKRGSQLLMLTESVSIRRPSVGEPPSGRRRRGKLPQVSFSFFATRFRDLLQCERGSCSSESIL